MRIASWLALKLPYRHCWNHRGQAVCQKTIAQAICPAYPKLHFRCHDMQVVDVLRGRHIPVRNVSGMAANSAQPMLFGRIMGKDTFLLGTRVYSAYPPANPCLSSAKHYKDQLVSLTIKLSPHSPHHGRHLVPGFPEIAPPCICHFTHALDPEYARELNTRRKTLSRH